jgi:hypothetical protein
MSVDLGIDLRIGHLIFILNSNGPCPEFRVFKAVFKLVFGFTGTEYPN